MTDTIGTYSFLPWLRQGLANEIVADATEGGRAVIDVQLELAGTGIGGADKTEPIDRRVALYGPGDVQGIDPRAVFRTEPKNWITNFEPNYLASVEFYDEDFPWRYTPFAPDGNGRLQPWIVLMVLEERETDPEFQEGRDLRAKPLPYIEIGDPQLFPPAGQLWCWAHVHVNRGLAANDGEFVSTDMGAVLPRMEAVLRENPDLAYSRLLCPRKLGENRAYHAFVIPAFESGRRAGLGLHPYEEPALPAIGTLAWENYPGRPEPTRYPCYYRWYFRTGGRGDFESLVRLLKPQKAHHDVGRRNLDAQHPGSGVRGIEEGRPDLGGILKLGGALKVPQVDFTPEELAEVRRHEEWATPFPQPIQEDIATLVNLADDYSAAAASAANAEAGIMDPDDPTEGNPDPVITPPLYGTWHAMAKRVLVDGGGAPLDHRTNWLHELNLDPRFRTAAGFGTRVVQDQQEGLMDAAWEQIGKVIEANHRIRLGQLALGTSLVWYDDHLRPLRTADPQKMLHLAAPLNKRLLHEGATVHRVLSQSLVQPAMTSAALRRVTRPRARLMKALPFSDQHPPRALLARVADGAVSAAPPKLAPPGATKAGDAARKVVPDAPSLLVEALRRHRWLPWAPFLAALLLIALLFLVAPAAPAVLGAGILAGAGLALSRRLSRQASAVHASDALGETSPTRASIDAISPRPDFRLTEVGSGFVPASGAIDSVEAARFKTALKETAELLGASARAGRVTPKTKPNLEAVAESVASGLDPKKTIPKRVRSSIHLPPRILDEMGEGFVEAMAYPEFDTPMYEPLKNIGAELFLPNLSLIAENSVTVLETNERFIESYMVGLNHEFARELLWREFPTDQRGSYFRQFWNVTGVFDDAPVDDAARREKMRDILRLDHWTATSDLGSHNNRGQETYLVLVIRGELLKRYPTAVIYAHRARWQRTNGEIDNSLERRFEELTPAEEAAPPRTKVRTPLFDAKVDPDVYLFGFDLDANTVRGGTGDPGDEEPGWFFVIKQRPGEPLFGLDLDSSTPLHVWNDLSWDDLQPGAPGSFLEIDPAIPAPSLVAPAPTDETFEQYGDDRNLGWNAATMTSAEVAYFLFQAPVLVGVHGSEMVGPG